MNETVFWRPSPEDRLKIVRTGRVQDTADGLSEFPHLIVNQARLLVRLYVDLGEVDPANFPLHDQFNR